MKEYFKTFFEEKNLPLKQWEIKDTHGQKHFISNEVVIESIYNASIHEQKQIKDILIKIDFHNGNVNHFLEHLAKSLINTTFI